MLSKLINYTSAVNAPVSSYRKQNENRVRKLYQQNSEKHHNCFVIEIIGLHVISDVLFIGGSPDARVKKCHGEGLLEIKCPYKYRAREEDKTFPINADNTIKTNHK